MNIKRFEKKTAVDAHDSTILGSNVLPDGMKAPFQHFYGYLEDNGIMAGHAHSTDEIYIVMKGNGEVVVGDERAKVSGGDVVEIPADVWHTMENHSGKPLLWAAIWWDVIK